MTYKSLASLPESVRHVLPKHAQEIYLETYNNAWAQYDQPEERLENRSRAETAHRIAWSAVKKQYVKDETTGKWIRKEKSAVR